MEFIADSVAALDYERVETQNLRPATFKGAPALRFDITAKTQGGLDMAGSAEVAQVGDKLFVLVEGRVRISREVSGMGEEALAVLGPGEVLGEMALFDESARSADDMRALFRDEVKTRLGRHPEVGKYNQEV